MGLRFFSKIACFDKNEGSPLFELYGAKYSRMNQVKFVEDSLQKIWSDMVCRPYHFKIFEGCLPQILLGPFLNTLSHIGQIKQAAVVFLFGMWKAHEKKLFKKTFHVDFS